MVVFDLHIPGEHRPYAVSLLVDLDVYDVSFLTDAGTLAVFKFCRSVTHGDQQTTNRGADCEDLIDNGDVIRITQHDQIFTPGFLTINDVIEQTDGFAGASLVVKHHQGIAGIITAVE